MKDHEIELWACRVLDRVAAKAKGEDDRVELKTVWPNPPKKAARQLAGAANAAGGAPVLWLIGVDEDVGPVPYDASIGDEWIKQVTAEFDMGHKPSVRMMAVPTPSGIHITALLINTEARPFLVKAGANQMDVPWREGKHTRSANRAELLQILAPLVTAPTIDLLKTINIRLADRTTTPRKVNGRVEPYEVSVSASLYLIPRKDSAVHLVAHKSKLVLSGNSGWSQDLPVVFYGPSSPMVDSGPLNTYPAVVQPSSQLLIDGPMWVGISALFWMEKFFPEQDGALAMRASLHLGFAETSVVLVEEREVPLVSRDVTGRRNLSRVWDLS